MLIRLIKSLIYNIPYQLRFSSRLTSTNLIYNEFGSFGNYLSHSGYISNFLIFFLMFLLNRRHLLGRLRFLRQFILGNRYLRLHPVETELRLDFFRLLLFLLHYLLLLLNCSPTPYHQHHHRQRQQH